MIFETKENLKAEDQAAKQAVLNVCQMMVDCLVENVLRLDESSSEDYFQLRHTYVSSLCTHSGSLAAF